jgi:DMSO reductase anchor subunit
MCVDRLEVGLKPACVTACLGNALDFGVVENVPENRVQAKTEIPGFPRTDITNPNIRFQQTRTPPKRDMHRVDLEPVKYHREEGSDSFKPQLDNKLDDKREWNLASLLGSHENAHIAFTLSAQTAMGGFAATLLAALFGGVFFELAAGFAPVLVIATVMISFGLYKLNMHLGKPHRFYRGFYNLRHSPVSREIAGVSLFFAGLAGYTLLSLLGYLSVEFPGQSIVMMAFAAVSIAGVCAGGYYMYRLYRIEARPFWNHWSTAASFAASAMTLGSLLVLLLAEFTAPLSSAMSNALMAVIFAGVALESIGLLAHAKYLRAGESEGAASYYLQTTRYGNAYWLRNMLLLVAFVISGISVANMNTGGDTGLVVYLVLLAVLLTSNVLGRALFYVVVIPTTMPGAFFWKNEGFVEHARQTGLADMPQLGVAYERHHKFDIAALLETIRTTSMKQKVAQFRSIFTG